MIFPVVVYRCEGWTIKKAEHQRIDTCEMYYWRRLLRVPWTARRSNQSILKEINPEYSLGGLVLKLKLRCFGHLMWGANSLVKTLMLGKIEGKSRRGRQRMRWQRMIWARLNRHEFEQILGDSERQGSLFYSSPCGHKESDMTELLNWTELTEGQRRPVVRMEFHLGGTPSPGLPLQKLKFWTWPLFYKQ